ncbi:hypothetical_protein-conserved [Leishmania major strain Friedlin]|nr:hypothetical_protein-conserved [Leishmania major strain Friedlin]
MMQSFVLLRNRLSVSEEYVCHSKDPAHSTCLEAAFSRSVEGACARCRETARMLTWASAEHSSLVRIHRTSAYTADTYRMQTLVVVFSTIYGVAFNGRGMNSPENRNSALALKSAFHRLLTQAWLSCVLTLCSASSRYERAMNTVSPDARPRAGA